MFKPSLLILAAGFGSRYHGSKQIDPVGPRDACIFDYTIYDAVKAGFKKIVFLILRQMEYDFKEMIASKYGRGLEIEYAFQEISNIPEGYSMPDFRKKPWGTGHAALSAKKLIKAPFAVVNADDYYGPASFSTMFNALKNMRTGSNELVMVGFRLDNTLSSYGTVSRGVCRVKDGYLVSIVERESIRRTGAGIVCEENNQTIKDIDPKTIVSMNFWGLPPDTIFPILEERFDTFIKENISNARAEFYLPSVIDWAVKEKQLKVKVLETTESWFGMTYAADKDQVREKIKRKIDQGLYPVNLFNRK